jgi:hypothetical protein
MKIEKVSYIFLIIVILFFGWKAYDYFNPNYKKKFDQNISKVNERRNELNEIVKLATMEISDKNTANYEMDLEEVSDELKEKMQKLGFRSFRYELISNCSEKYIFYFIAWEDWNTDNLNHVEIIYSPCDSETKKGFHSFDGGHIDVFGAGENWKILSDTDFI